MPNDWSCEKTVSLNCLTFNFWNKIGNSDNSGKRNINRKEKNQFQANYLVRNPWEKGYTLIGNQLQKKKFAEMFTDIFSQVPERLVTILFEEFFDKPAETQQQQFLAPMKS